MTDPSSLGGALPGIVNLAGAGDHGGTGPVGGVVAKAGDTLHTIAADTGHTVEALLDANPGLLHANAVQAGQEVRLPGPGAGADRGAPNGAASVTGPSGPSHAPDGHGVGSGVGKLGQDGPGLGEGPGSGRAQAPGPPAPTGGSPGDGGVGRGPQIAPAPPGPGPATGLNLGATPGANVTLGGQGVALGVGGLQVQVGGPGGSLLGGALQGVGSLAGGLLGGLPDGLAAPVSGSGWLSANPAASGSLNPGSTNPGAGLAGTVQAADGVVADVARAVAGTTGAEGGAPAATTNPASGGASLSEPADAPSAGSAVAPGAPSGAAGGLTLLTADAPADFRLLAQAGPLALGGLASVSATSVAAPTLLQQLAAIDPALAQLVASALSSPALRAAALPQVLGELAAALSSLGWTPTEVNAKLGEVVLILGGGMLAAGRVPEGGLTELLSGLALASAEPLVLSPPSAQPAGVDAQAPARLRGRAAGEDFLDSKRKSARDDRDPDSPSSEDPRRAWIDRALPAARAVKARWGVPVAITLAQGALASDWGRLAPGHDYFGLGARRAATPALPPPSAVLPALRGQPVGKPFQGVDDAADAFGAFLNAAPRFARALRAGDAATFAARLGEAGFSSDPRHGEQLRAIMEDNGLLAFDL